MIQLEVAIPIAIALTGTIGILWKHILDLSRQLRESEREKLDLVQAEYKSTQEMALAVFKDEDARKFLMDKLERVDARIEEIKSMLKK